MTTADTEPLVKLGDVRQWLKEGDVVELPGYIPLTIARFDSDGRLVRTRLATRKDVRVGMRAFTISLTTNCPDLPVEILAEAPETDAYAELEEFAAMTHEERQRKYVAQPGRRHGKTAEQQARRDALEAAIGPGGVSPLAETRKVRRRAGFDMAIEELGSVTWTGKDPKGRVEIPIRDTRAALREEFRFIADRVDWDLVATVSRMRRETDLSASVLRNYADSTFERACSNGKGWSSMSAGAGSGMFVVLQPENTKRPVELYLEALNAAAYHAKCEEMWPKPERVAEKPTGACRGCKAPFWSGGAKEANYARQLCADCSLVELVQPTATPAPEAFPLTPAARYHLADDTGWSTPGWEA